MIWTILFERLVDSPQNRRRIERFSGDCISLKEDTTLSLCFEVRQAPFPRPVRAKWLRRQISRIGPEEEATPTENPEGNLIVTLAYKESSTSGLPFGWPLTYNRIVQSVHLLAGKRSWSRRKLI